MSIKQNLYLKRCIQLAKLGLGNTYPNPLVGCVIVHNGKIIGEGYHKKAGEAHAEVNAINAVKGESLLPKSTIYVSLEPCSHFGKTPPCADLIIKSGFKNVVIGTQDPFAKVNGLGIKKLLEAGCHVKVGVCENECLELNKRFFTFHQKKRPYIILKWAESQDGFISPYTLKDFDHKAPVWLTNPVSKQLVHQWRAEEMAILVGTHTALMDNPELSVRLAKGHNPIRLLIDRSLKVPETHKIFNKASKTFVFTEIEKDNNEHISYYKIDFSTDIIPQLIEVLFEKGIQSIIVEGGKYTLEAFIKRDLWDEARVFKTNTALKKGTKAPEFNHHPQKSKYIIEDCLNFFYNN
jgi:diaminohydroxyphosphoribosylaminopyrimidine deaminase/5-amino-6-(5-phosphoribosylamino)uracil reductase